MKRLLFILPFLLIGCGETPKTADSAKPAETKTVEVVKVTAADLLKAYNENEVAGDQKYKDKTLEVTGKIDDIQSGIGSDKFVILKAGGANEFNKPRARFAETETAKIATLKKGADIKMQCMGDGEVMKSPMLKDCKIL